jgi:uncharacterized protein YecT (DUF1311 family)
MAEVLPDTPEIETAAAPAPVRRWGVAAAAGLAALASAGLAWWLSAPEQPAPARVVIEAPRPAPVRAPAAADEDQVRQAYEQVQAVYATAGADGLARFARTCDEALAKDARVLDYCLAFEMFAGAVAPPDGEAGRWFAAGGTRRMTLAEAALPAGADPADRIAEVEQLMRRASGADAVVRAEPVREAAAAPIARPARRETPKVAAAKRQARLAIARKTAKSRAATHPPDRCARVASPAERVLCANPDLEAADARLRRAYSQALEVGVDPIRLAREQASWRQARDSATTRDAMARVYARRIEELEQAAPGIP